MHFWVFFKVKIQTGDILWGLLKFQIVLGVLEIPVLGGGGYCFFSGGGGGGGGGG